MSQGNLRRRAAGLLMACLMTSSAWAGDDKGFSIGLQGSAHATLADVGLPGYPGATLSGESHGDTPAASLGAWAGSFGLRINVMKFQVADSPVRVATFYAKALGRHGAVLDCREPAARVKPPKDSDTLACEEGVPPAGEYEFRAGTAKQFRVVHISPHGDGGARFEMARIALGN
ncbi:hypothetical protein ASC95_03440 [Pelomonas sp. Root1217]|uniref:hypothetical protein n=1 Tax=Pelomonas sp. Root1217 TaxID=1736430 RepID=UPI00070ECC96|nr:hypothetical protein [Pelomonas sp. Root1217]KQV60517.1 hypothetical protein ASC95_03440 [Pelomonas sp. Root1217]